MAVGGLKQFARSCKDCERLRNSESFAKGSKVKIFEAYDCENCEVREYQPIVENEDVIELYDILPDSFDASGTRMVNVSDIMSVLELLDVPKELWSDIYQRMVYYHREIVKTVLKVGENKRKSEKDIENWKREKFRNKRVH